MKIGKLYSHVTGKPYYARRKKVLVLEGGGMRGVFLTGILQHFTDMDYFPWKMIIGSSAGALTGTAYASRQIHIARDAFFTELLSGKFIKLTNILRPERHILNLDWMVDTIVQGEETLNLRRLKKSSPVYITATDCRPNNPPRTIYLSSLRDDVPVALKATAAIPFLYRGFVKYKDYNLLDGALLDPIPYRKALAMGYKEEDILVVLTRQRGYRKKEESFWIKTLLESYYKDSQYRFLVDMLDKRYMLYNRILDELENDLTGIDVIYPPDNFAVDRLTRDEKKILHGFEVGVSAAKAFLRSISG